VIFFENEVVRALMDLSVSSYGVDHCRLSFGDGECRSELMIYCSVNLIEYLIASYTYDLESVDRLLTTYFADSRISPWTDLGPVPLPHEGRLCSNSGFKLMKCYNLESVG
jgi:hypothetical protein